MKKIPTFNDSGNSEIVCSVCLLPMNYQFKQKGKFVWQCFKCGKQIQMNDQDSNQFEEGWSPPR